MINLKFKKFVGNIDVVMNKECAWLMLIRCYINNSPYLVTTKQYIHSWLNSLKYFLLILDKAYKDTVSDGNPYNTLFVSRLVSVEREGLRI